MKINKLNILLLALMTLSSSMILAPKKEKSSATPVPRSGRRGGMFCCCGKDAIQAATGIALTSLTAELILYPDMPLRDAITMLMRNFAHALTEQNMHRSLSDSSSAQAVAHMNNQIHQILRFLKIDPATLEALTERERTERLENTQAGLEGFIAEYAKPLQINHRGELSWLAGILDQVAALPADNGILGYVAHLLRDALLSDSASSHTTPSIRSLSLIAASQRTLMGGAGVGSNVEELETDDRRTSSSRGSSTADLDLAVHMGPVSAS